MTLTEETIDLTARLIPWRKTIQPGLTWRGWRSAPSGKPLIQFVHGNGLCCLAYSPFLNELLKAYDLFLFDIQGHGDSDTGTQFLGWEQQAAIMSDIWQVYQSEYGEVRRLGLGHSMGGVLTLLRASRFKSDFSRLCLIDPVLLSPSMILGARLDQLLRTKRAMPLAEQARRRVNGWPDEHAAFRFFHRQPFFKAWSSASLNAFIQHGLKPENGKLKLKCPPSMEASIFDSVPHSLWPAIKKLRTPTDILFGSTTFPFIESSVDKACRKNPNIRGHQLPGDHCFVQARPVETAHYLQPLLTGAEHAVAASV